MAARQNSLKNFVFSGEPEPAPASAPSYLPLAAIARRESQPRHYFDPHKLAELTESIRQHGILEPLLVRPLDSAPQQYELVAGERRYRAAHQAGLAEVPVTIRELGEQEALAISLVENLQREDLNPVEETEGILQLLSFRLDLPIPEVVARLYRMRNEASGTVSQNVLTNSEGQAVQAVFDSLGSLSWESFITSRLPLLKLPAEVLEVLRQGKIAYTKAKAIAKVKDEQLRRELLQEAIAQELSLSQIKQRLQELTAPTTTEVTPEKKIKDTMSRLAKSRIWKDGKKKKKLERLLEQLEALMSA